MASTQLAKTIFRVLTVLALAAGVSGCEPAKLKDQIDVKWFEQLGETLFDDTHQITTKELHLDSGAMLGKRIIFEGQVVSKGQYDTYVLMRDSSGRMLVVLTQVIGAEKTLAEPVPKRLKILGTVERGKKGLPYILAEAMSKAGFPDEGSNDNQSAFVAPVPTAIPDLPEAKGAIASQAAEQSAQPAAKPSSSQKN